MTGTVKKITESGFGFVSDGAGRDYFFHHSGVIGARLDELRPGQMVEFDAEPSIRGLRATNVVPLN